MLKQIFSFLLVFTLLFLIAVTPAIASDELENITPPVEETQTGGPDASSDSYEQTEEGSISDVLSVLDPATVILDAVAAIEPVEEDAFNNEKPAEETDSDILSLYDRLASAESASDMLSLLQESSSDAEALTHSELQSLLDKAEGFDEGEEKTDLLDTLNYLLGKGLEETTYGNTAETLEASPDGYTYFDLAAGNVTINAATYSGYVFEYGTNTAVEVSGQHSNDNKYYVYQSSDSSRATSGYDTQTGQVTVPKYDRVSKDGRAWTDFITNNTDPTSVANAWTAAAEAVGRSSTGYYVSLAGNGEYSVTIDNLWSTINTASQSRTTGGVCFSPTAGGKAILSMKGDSRFGNIYYEYSNTSSPDADGFVNGTGIVFQDGETGSQPGSVTVVSYNGKANHYDSVIGGNDNGIDDSAGIIIRSGVIYAGAQTKSGYTGAYQIDNCSAIGGGGNGLGVVTILGGKVTAVVSSTGAAIGGGIGENAAGGAGIVTITGGEVYAYNFGYVTYTGGKAYPVPAAAIGGASSREQAGNSGTVTITGGTVYALSVGGAAIGGGSSTKNRGGNTDISIGGTANVTARSVAGLVNNVDVAAGASIGGGTAGSLGSGIGGNAVLSISGGTIRTGSIGGGACNNATGTIGNADVTISGGTIQGQVVMAAGGTVPCSFLMTGGLLDNGNRTDDYVFLKKDGGAVWMDDPSGTADISGGTIQNCSGVNGGAIYMTAGSLQLSGAGTIASCSASDNGGAAYLGGGSVTIFGGTIKSCYADGDDSFGGAIYLANGDLSMSNGTITDCSASSGGAVYITGGDFIITGGTMTDNAAVADIGEGGAVYVTGGSVTIGTENSEDDTLLNISNNTAYNGGAVSVSGSTPVLYCGTLSGNTADNNGGAVYVSGSGGFDMYGGSIDGNNAKDGGGIYVSGGDFTMISGSLTNNTAEHYGGGAYASGGCITIGVENCSGEGDKHSTAYTGLDHPEVLENTSAFGGGLAIDCGTVNIYCGTIDNNISDNNGTGMNIFMFDSDSSDDKLGEVNFIGGTVGEDTNHGIVVIGGTLNLEENDEVVTIIVRYHDNIEYSLKIWVGSSALGSWVNLPYCPQDWETAQNGAGYTFVGWTYDSTSTEDNPGAGDLSDLSYIRDKSAYKALGDPIEIKKVDWKYDDSTGGYYIDFYAVWAPILNEIDYSAYMDNYGSAEDVVEPLDTGSQAGSFPTEYTYQLSKGTITIPQPSVPGYTFSGWHLIADSDVISNWASDASITDGNPSYDGCSFYSVTTGSGIDNAGNEWLYDTAGNLVITTNQSFGYLDMMAVFDEDEAEYTYIAVGPAGETFGSISLNSEVTGAATGSLSGSTATISNYIFRFAGWYTDAECTVPVTMSWVDENNTITPRKGSDTGLYSTTTYYAKFEYSKIIDGLVWFDSEAGDGIQDSGDAALEGLQVSLLVLEDDRYVPYYYKGTRTPVVIKTGEMVSVEDPDSVRVYEALNENGFIVTGTNRYMFTDLPAGTYAVKFEGADTDISGWAGVPVNQGDDDAKDSDATPVYTETSRIQGNAITLSILDHSVIEGVVMTETETQEIASHSDAGFSDLLYSPPATNFTLPHAGGDGSIMLYPVAGSLMVSIALIIGRWSPSHKQKGRHCR